MRLIFGVKRFPFLSRLSLCSQCVRVRAYAQWAWIPSTTHLSCALLAHEPQSEEKAHGTEPPELVEPPELAEAPDPLPLCASHRSPSAPPHQDGTDPQRKRCPPRCAPPGDHRAAALRPDEMRRMNSALVTVLLGVVSGVIGVFT